MNLDTVPEVSMPPILDDLTGEDPRDASQDQLRELRELFMNGNGWGLFFFANFVCGYDKLIYPLHFEIGQYLSLWWSTLMKDGTSDLEYVDPSDDDVEISYRRLMLCIPRDC